MILALVHELLELAVLGTLIAGGVCIVALGLHVLLLAAGFGKDRPREYRMYELVGKLGRLFSRKRYEPRSPGWEEHVRETLPFAWTVDATLLSTDWLTVDPFSGPHPHGWP